MTNAEIMIFVTVATPVTIGAAGGVFVGAAAQRRELIRRSAIVLVVVAIVGVCFKSVRMIVEDADDVTRARARFSGPYVERIRRVGPFIVEYSIEEDRKATQPRPSKGGLGGFYRGAAYPWLEMGVMGLGFAIGAGISGGLSGYVMWRLSTERRLRRAETSELS